jgi:thiol-disulfide isomerase/thioredoxin
MSRTIITLGALLIAGVCLASPTPATAEDRSAEKILADIKAVEMPKVPEDRTDGVAVQEFITKRQKATERKAELIGELLKAHPDSPELPKLILERWQAALLPGPKSDEMKAEVEGVLSKSKNQKLVAEAAFVQAIMAFRKAGADADPVKLMPAVEEFLKRAPNDDRGAMFLSAIASKTTDAAKKAELEKRLEKDYPNSPVVKQKAAERRQQEGIGKPFELTFNDAIKGGTVSMADLKGKVVIIDFWATWCGPCVAEMPNMKKLYAEYKDKGVEFIGVSLDKPKEAGGLDALKKFVAENKIEWPQYYQGNYWESEFSMSWGINGIPAVFAVGTDGNLASTEARGKLEELIPQLLEKGAKSRKVEAKP